MSDHSESGSSGLADWALVNSQGELESSDVESNTSSIEVVGREAETEEELGHSAAVSRETSPECFELERLMRKADAESAEQRVPEPTEAEAPVAEPATVPYNSSDASASSPEQQPQEVAGACCSELLQSAERIQSTGEGEKVTAARQLSQESDSHTSSESILSLSGISSLSNTSKSSRADSDSESDFVRLEKESPSVSSHDSEEEEPMPGSGVIAMTTSASSVGSGFNFLSGARASSEPPSLSQPLMQTLAPPPPPQHYHQQQQEEEQQQQPLQELLEEQPPPPPPPAPVQQEEPAPLPQEPERPPSPHEEEEVEVQHEEDEVQREEIEVQQQLLLHQQPEAVEAAAGMVMHDADDTESSIGDHDEDDRIESEQSDDTNSAHADDLDQGDLSLVNDLGDLPLERGDAERHYTHHNNQQLNGRLNQVLLAVVVLAVGMGLGHWIGSAREHFSQMEIQLAQIKRLHQMQDEYVQCLARNDELLLDYDNTLQGERERHQEAMADLRDNNRELQEQLQDAQDQLERILTAQAQEARSRNSRPGSGGHGQSSNPTLADVQNILTMSSLLIARDADFEAHTAAWSHESRQAVLQARQSLAKSVEDKQRRRRFSEAMELQHERDELSLLLGEARQNINNLKNENAELKLSVGKMRYNVDSLAREPASQEPLLEEEEEEPEDMPLPPPPNPIPPPPLVGDISAEEILDFVAVEVEEEENVEDDIEQRPQLDIPEPETRHPKLAHGTDSPKTVPVDVTLLQRNLTQERQRADMWRRLYLTARVENRKEQPINSSACLRFLSQQMNMSALMHYVMHWNLTRVGGTEDFVNLTTLVSSIIQLQRNLVDALPSLWDELSSTFHGFHSKEDAGEEDRSSGAGASVDEKPGLESNKGEPHKSKWSDGVKNLFNKTRGTLSNVSQQLQQTWSQVKDASRQLWPGDDTLLGRMASRVKEGVSKLSHKVKKKASRWFKKHSKEERKGHRKKARTTFQEQQSSEKPLKKRDEKRAAKHHAKQQPQHTKELNKKRKFNHRDERNEEEEELQKKKKRKQKAGRVPHKNMETNQNKRVKHADKHNQAEARPQNHRDGKKQNKPSKHADKPQNKRDSLKEGKVEKHHKKKSESAEHHQNGPGGGKKDTKFNQPMKDKVRHQRHLHQDSPDRAEEKVKMNQPGKEEARKSKKSAEDSHRKRTMSAESSDHRPGAASQSIETEFHTKAKHHSSHAEKAAAKAKFKLEKQFQKLFSRIGSLGRHGFYSFDKDDISEMIHKVGDISGLFVDGNSLGLPESGHHWLKCQLYWWVKAQPQHMLYLPSDNCIQYLAQWQLSFMEETKRKLETGECRRERKFSCIDPPPEDEEDYYKYICFGDEGYYRPELDGNAQEATHEAHGKNNMKEAHHSPKGTRENDPHTQDSPRAEEVSERSKQQVNQTEEDNAWYFKWVQGRDNLRAGEHKADWVFERAANRDESRHREHTADWVFERAADRDEHRQGDNDEEDDDGEEDEDNGHWRAQRRDWNKHGKRSRHFKHKGRKHRHDSEEGPFKHHGRDFRQKYGRTTFCDFC